MSKAFDCLALVNENEIYIRSLKRILRFIGAGDVLLTFNDGSQLAYHYDTQSWRNDRLEILKAKDD